MFGSSLVLAANEASGGGTDWLTYLLQGGPFALILALIILDKLAPTGERDRLREENKQLKEDQKELNQTLLTVIPPLIEATKGLSSLTSTVVEVGDLLDDLRDDKRESDRVSRRRGGG